MILYLMRLCDFFVYFRPRITIIVVLFIGAVLIIVVLRTTVLNGRRRFRHVSRSACGSEWRSRKNLSLSLWTLNRFVTNRFDLAVRRLSACKISLVAKRPDLS